MLQTTTTTTIIVELRRTEWVSIFILVVRLAAVAGSLFTMLLGRFEDPCTHAAACRA